MCEEGCEWFEARKSGDISDVRFVYNMTNGVAQ